MDDGARELLLRWVQKAEADWLAIGSLLAGQRIPWDVVCFHCQQTAEKYLKALLITLDVEFEPMHDLLRLARLASGVEPELRILFDPLSILNPYSVQVRYPDDWREIEQDEGTAAVEQARTIRLALRNLISARLDQPLP